MEILRYDKRQYYHDMTKTTSRLIKQNDGVYRIDIPEEYVTQLGWRNGFILQIDVDNNKIVIEKLGGFMGR